MKSFKQILSSILIMVMLLSSSVNMTASAEEAEVIGGEELAVVEKTEHEITDTEVAEVPSVVTERGMQFRIDNLEDVKSIRYAYGEYETEKDIKYGESAVSHSAKNLRKRGDSCTLQFPKPGLVSIVVTYNDGNRDFYKYEVIKSEPTVTRDGGNTITFENLNDLKVLRYVKGEYESSYDIKRATGSVAISGKNIDSDTYTVDLNRETYTFCVQYNDESYNYYVTGVYGDNLTWVYDMQSATLTISGEGEMDEYYYKDIPWYGYRSDIKNLILNEGITAITQDAFGEINQITEIRFPSTLKTIGNGAFIRCTSLAYINIPGNVEYIGQGAFESCVSLESVTMEEGVIKIDICAFWNCRSLKTVTFPSSLKEIGDLAFAWCASLNNIHLPDTAIEIYADCFFETAFAKNPDNWDNQALYLDNYLIILADDYNDTSFAVRDGTKYIAGTSIYGNNLKTVTIPATVKAIYKYAIQKNVRIYCYKNSYAHQYAYKNGYSYSFID